MGFVSASLIQMAVEKQTAENADSRHEDMRIT
jgi:hypothetical protein